MWVISIVSLLVPLSAVHLSQSMLAPPRRTMLRGVTCNANVPCPAAGYTCMYSPFAVGTKACFSNVAGGAAERRAGRCPAVAGGGGAQRPITRGACWWHSDCAPGERCCASADGMGRCAPAVPVDPRPQVTQLIEGRHWKHFGSVALVQAAGKNVLFDVGGYQTAELLKNALVQNGLSFDDVDYIVASHGHTDHVSNLGMFPDVRHNYFTFIVDGDSPSPNGLAKSDRVPVLDNADIELIRTPGHTPQDIAMVVSNVPGKGTVVLSADCVMDEADVTAKTLPNGNSRSGEFEASRALVVCQADWILPGHGPMFQVTDEMRSSFQC